MSAAHTLPATASSVSIFGAASRKTRAAAQASSFRPKRTQCSTPSRSSPCHDASSAPAVPEVAQSTRRHRRRRGHGYSRQANANKFGHLRLVNGLLGLYGPVLATPLELLGEADESST
jgi:hypothetical protein